MPQYQPESQERTPGKIAGPLRLKDSGGAKATRMADAHGLFRRLRPPGFPRFCPRQWKAGSHRG
jgi:hypothetical protein